MTKKAQIDIQWREVLCHPNYSVSTDGKVRNNKTGRILKQFLGGTGRNYLCVSLNGKKRGVHTLVAEAFLPHEDYQTYVVHKDGDRKNNHVDNLMWKTDHYNVHPDYIRVEKYTKAQFRRAFEIACDLLCGAYLYGIDTDKLFSLVMDKYEVVSMLEYQEFILENLDRFSDDDTVREKAIERLGW